MIRRPPRSPLFPSTPLFRSRLFSIIRGNGLARRLASRFVAGETVEAAVAALTQLNAAGIRASLDLLGESVAGAAEAQDRKSTRLNSSHSQISYAVFCLKKKK